MQKPLAVLNIEDSESDSGLIARLLKKAGYKVTFERVDTAAQMRAALKKRAWDIIISDHSLPQFDSYAALALLQEEGLDIPFITVSGTIGEEIAVAMIKAGAHDFLVKDNLSRLIPTVERELEQVKVRRERKQAQEALRESESRFRQVWETTSDAMVLSDSEGIVLAVNPAYLSLYNFSSEQVIGHSFAIIFPKKYQKDAVKQYKVIFTSDIIPSSFEGVISRADGTQRVVESRATFITNAEGTRVAMLSTSRDITERKQADDALHASEKHFRALIENGLDDISLLTADGTLIWESPSVVRNLEYTPNEFLGHNIFELMHQDDLERIQNLYAKLIQKPGSRQASSFRLKRRDGTWRWVEAIATNMLDEPSVQAIVINYRDVTEQRQAENTIRESEDRYRDLVENSQDLICTHNIDGLILTANPVSARILGYEPGELIGRNLRDLLAPEVQDHFKYYLSKLRRHGTASGLLLVQTKSGERRIWEYQNTVRSEGLAEPVVRGMARDITELKQAEEAFNKTRDDYQRLFDRANDVILIFEPEEEIILEVNAAACAIYGFSRDELIGMSLKKLTLNVTQGEAQIRDTLENRSYRDFESIHINKNGQKIYFLINASVVEYQNKEAILSINHDITERKQAEEVVRDSESRYRSLFEDSPIALWEEDFSAVKQLLEALREQGVTNFQEYFKLHPQEVTKCRSLVKVLNVNEAAIKLSNAEKKDDLLKSIAELSKDEPLQQFQNELVNIAEGKTVFGWEGVVRTNDGKQKNIDLGWRAVRGYENSLSKVIVSMIDITERKHTEAALVQSEQAHRTLFENVPVGLYRTTVDGRIVDANPALVRMFGYHDRESLLAVKVEDLYVDPVANEKFNSELVKSNIIIRLEAEFRKNDGTTFWAEDHIQVIRDENGNPLFYEGSLTDITERLHAQAEVKNLAKFPDQNPDPIMRVNDKGIILYANKSSREMLKEWKIEAGLVIPPIMLMNTLEAFKTQAQQDIEVSLGPRVLSFMINPVIQEGYANLYGRDITERKRSEEALRESEERFHSLFNRMMDGVYRSRHEGKFVDVNPAMVKMFGYSSREEMLAVNIKNELYFEPEERGSHILDTGQEEMDVYRMRRKDGSEIWVEDHGSYVHDEQGNIIYHEGILRDITERKQAEQALAKSEALYRQAMEVAGAVPYYESYYDNYEKIKYDFIGEGIRQITGYGPEEFTGALWDTLVLDSHPLNELSAYSLEEAIQQVRSGAVSIWQCEYRIRHRDGGIHWVFEAAVELRDEHGVAYGSIGTYQDITERKRADQALAESESRFRQAVAAADAIPYSLTYASDHYTFIGDGITKLAGYSLEEMTPALLDSLITESIMHGVFEGVPLDEAVKLVREGKSGSFWRCDHRIRTHSGEERWISDSSVQVLDENGIPKGSVGIIQDITERKQIEAAAREGEARYRSLFEESPVSLWEEDFSAVKLRLDSLRNEGIKDFRAYFASHPQIIPEYISLVKIVDVNKATLKLFGAKEKADLLQNLTQLIDHDSAQLFQNELISIAQGKSHFEWEGVNQTLDGRQIIISLGLSVLPGYEDTFSKVIISMIDITTRLQAEKAIRESEKSLRESQMIAGLGSYTLDVPPGKWTSSDILNQIFGIDESHIRSVESWTTLIHPDWRKEMSDYFANEVLGNHIRFDKEYKIVRNNDGAERWVHGLGELQLDAQNQPVKMRGTIQDITERKQAEEKLRKSEKRFRNLADNSPDVIYVLDLVERRLVFFNRQEFCGFSRQELETSNSILATVHPDEQSAVSNHWQSILSGNPAESQIIEYRLRRKDGKWEWIQSREIILERDKSDRPTQLLVTLTLITERKQAEEALQKAEIKYRMLVERLPVIVYTSELGENGAWTYISPQIEHLLGFTAEEWMADPELWYQQVHADDRERQQKLEEQAWAQQESFEGEYRMSTRDGRQIWVRDSALILPPQNNGAPIVQGMLMDVTERKQAEEALRKSEQRYRALFEDMPVAIWEEDFSDVKKYLDSLKEQGVTDFRTYFKHKPEAFLECATMIKVLDVNQATLKMYHAESKEDLYKNMDDGLSESEVEHILDALIAISEEKTNHGWEGVDETVNGEPIEVNLNWSVAPGHEADFSKVIVTTLDVTERKQSERALQESEKRFRSLIANAGDLIVVIDPNGVIQFASPSSERILGYTPEEALGRNFTEWVHPSDLAEVLESLTSRSEETGVALESVRARGRHKDGSWRILDTIGTSLINEPEIQDIVLNIRDITERELTEEALRASEAQFRAIFEGAAIGIALVDPSGHPVSVNSALEEMLGYDAHELRNMVFTDFTHPDDVTLDWGLWQELIAGKRDHYQIEKRFIHKDKHVIWVKLTSSIVPGNDGRILFGVGMVEDITERKKAEAENKYQLSELEALYENGLAISRLLEPKRIAQRMVEVIDQKLDWHHAAIRLYDASTDRLELLALNFPGFNEAQITKQIERINQTINTPDKGLSGWVIRHGEVIRIGNLKNDPRYFETYAGINSGLYVPIKSGEDVIGSIAIESEQENAFTERDEYTLTTLANQAAISFINARLYFIVQKELNERHRAEEDVRRLNVELEQRVAERTTQIEATKRRLELATHAGQIGVWEYVPRENKVIWDERMHMIHQIPAGGFDGTSQMWARLVHPDDLEKSQINKQLAFTQNLLFNNEHRIILPDGSIRNINTSSVTVFSEDGTPDRVIGISMDITERKQIEHSLRDSENYARLLFDAVADPVSVTERNALIVDVNKAFEKQYSLARDEIRGKRISDLGIYPEAELEKREKYLLEILQGQPAKPIELDFYVPGDRVHTLELHSYLLKVNDRELVLNSAHDITSHKKAEETQRLAKSEMERALRIKNEFLANMSHELRTPLNSILGISESLEEQIAGTLNEKQLKYIGVVRESGRHLLELINDILDLSKIEAGRMELDIHRVSVETLCQASLRMIKELSQKKSLHVSFKVKGDIKIILADQRRIKQTLVNLLSNAVKFTPDGKEIGLEVEGNTQTNEVEFTVWDQGVGITHEDTKLLFKPFVQLDAGLAREYQGTGLGLALVAQMIHLHGGRVRIESEVGKGSRFIITLPWLPDEQTPKAKVTAKLVYPSPSSDEKRNGRILLVEDTDVVVQLISEYLRYKGYEVLLANNGVEAIKLAAQEHPDLILMDVMMPIMDGLEATRRIRTDKTLQNIPIIALTALAMSGDSERCLAAGMNDYISKPIQMQELTNMIEKYLELTRKK